MRTPDAGSSASAVKSARDRLVQAMVFAMGSWNDGPHRAPATSDVVSCGRSRAPTRTGQPASARQMAVVRPLTPAPMTSASVSIGAERTRRLPAVQ